MSDPIAADDDLTTFFADAKARGMSDDVAIALLRRNGWSERRVYAALASSYGALGVTIPKRAGQTESARWAFYYLLNFLSLGLWSVALGQIFYFLIARWLPDRVASPYGYSGPLRESIAWQLATVIVAFPLFAFVHFSIQRQLTARPELYDYDVHKWLTYVALIVAACVVLGDGIWFLYSLISGGLTLRFVLDCLVLLVLAGGVFAYYLTTIDGPQKE
ncbi:MAG: hypothetical protein IAI49_05730 [Candidatus Eremiobacteraeota bacterium]|nr:hypothetical protein [Candidatus Eremiobacteraeota bacterium]